MRAERIVKKLLASADIKINGNRKGDIKVHNPHFYSRILAKGSLGLGESYMDRWWDCNNLEVFFAKLLYTNIREKVKPASMILPILVAKIFNLQTKKLAKKVAKVHYNLGNDFYQDMLDKNMQYSCAYFKDTKNLDKAQEKKMELICKKLNLKETDTVLEIGGGWGGLAKYMAKNYGCTVVSYNISSEQVKHARKISEGLPVKVIQKDYRDAQGKYDKIVSVGMFEHVGPKNYKTFLKLAHKCLKKHGLFLLHTIGSDKQTPTGRDPWLGKYIFPYGSIPSAKQLVPKLNGKFVIEDWHNFGYYYSLTTYAWWENFEKNWHKHKEKYGERFYRMWRYYLLACAGNFRARKIQLWQIVLSKDGILKGYNSIR